MVDRDDDPSRRAASRLPDDARFRRYRAKLRAAWTAEDVRRAVRDGEDPDAVNSEEEQWTMLMWAAAREEADGEALLRAVISAGADVEKKSAGGSTALVWAARAGVANAAALAASSHLSTSFHPQRRERRRRERGARQP